MSKLKLYESDYVLIKDGEPVEGLEDIYSHEALAEWVNTGHVFMLADGEQLVSMKHLPAELQERYLADIRRRMQA